MYKNVMLDVKNLKFQVISRIIPEVANMVMIHFFFWCEKDGHDSLIQHLCNNSMIHIILLAKHNPNYPKPIQASTNL